MKTPVPESLFSEAEAYNFIKNEALAQVFSCEFCEIAKNTFSYRTSPMAASVMIFVLGQVKPFHKNEYGLIFEQEYF